MAQGVAGTGKTTLALHFLRAGADAGEACVYVTLSQSKNHLERIARSHGWTLDGIAVHELTPGTVAERVAARQTVLPTAEVELGALFEDLEHLVRSIRPVRAVIDSITIVQMLAGSASRYHREVVTLRQLFVERGCTVLALADHPAEGNGGQPAEVIFHPLCGVVIDLSQKLRAYGDARRQVRVVKARALASDGGAHDMKILVDGMQVYPRLGAYDKAEYDRFELVPSGVETLDRVLGGGLERGTTCLVVGPSGVGKSSFATLFARAGALRGHRVAIYLFDERPETYKARADGIGLRLTEHIDAARIDLCQLDPAEIAPAEFAKQVQDAVEGDQVGIVVIDSLAGYFNAVGSSNVFTAQLHELLTFLSRSGVLTILCAAQEGFMSLGHLPGVDVSYLSDTILVLGYYETDGAMHRFLTAAKRRQGEHQTTLRELTIDARGLHLGETLTGIATTYLPRAAVRRNPDADGNE